MTHDDVQSFVRLENFKLYIVYLFIVNLFGCLNSRNVGITEYHFFCHARVIILKSVGESIAVNLGQY